MSWTKLGDEWCQMTALEDLSHADRWHYLCLIQFCSRTDKRDGIMRGVDARRQSDHADPASALANLAAADLLAIEPGDRYRLVRIESDDHLPSDATRKRTEGNKLRQQRKRAHDKGDHSLCREDSPCHASVTRDVGTGRDGTGRDKSTNSKLVTPTSTWPVVHISNAPVCEVCLMPMQNTSLTVCATDDEAHNDARMRSAS
ncbi:hypothetical protein [Curtobacterium sp. MCBA15_004]|uniref:hypothetical protein n=1 Tax=Curtobacterium sp. MCBA15_004 TaxID=1898733 RepID=UPI0008DC7D5E|nr:hypothetical protein [Curtobacterium sp. MCBA15_004]WIA98037.1 hypothetical protein QOL16_06520 [Curtobacterium sp. MCBA15_004]